MHAQVALKWEKKYNIALEKNTRQFYPAFSAVSDGRLWNRYCKSA